jgi:hypothetical protein
MSKTPLSPLSSLAPRKGEASRPEPLPDVRTPEPRLGPDEGPQPDPRTAMTYRPRFHIHRKLKLLAVKRGVSMQDLIDSIIEPWVQSQRIGNLDE